MLVGNIRKKLMLQKETKLKPCDNSGIHHVKCIRVIGKSKLLGFVGDLLAVVIQKLKKKNLLWVNNFYEGSSL